MLLNLEHIIDKYECNLRGVLHIGAHYGEEYELYNKLNISPMIFIEALPQNFKVLQQKLKNTSSLCINTAVGNMEGEVEMYVDDANSGGSSSILLPKLHLTYYPHISFSKKIKVPITKIDKMNIPKCNFINIDIQGYELEALKGASNYLKTVEYLILEVNRDETYENCSHIDEIDLFLKSYNIHRVETSWDGIIWGDAFYIKK